VLSLEGLKAGLGACLYLLAFHSGSIWKNSDFLCEKGVVTAGPDLVDGQKAALRLVWQAHRRQQAGHIRGVSLWDEEGRVLVRRWGICLAPTTPSCAWSVDDIRIIWRRCHVSSCSSSGARSVIPP